MTDTLELDDPIKTEVDLGTGLQQPAKADKEPIQSAGRQIRPYRAIAAGSLLILFGLVFLLQNFDLIEVENWWAWLLLVPAGTSFAAAWSEYQETGHQLTARARRSGAAGVIFASLAGFFLLGLDIVIFGPLLLILLGIALFVNALFKA